jgi:hypothetical protein
LYSITDYQFAIKEGFVISKSKQPILSVQVTGKLPINELAKQGLFPPSIAIQGTTAPTGGTIKAGQRYYIQVCARESAGPDGPISAPSDPTAPCIVDVPAGADTATITVGIINWPSGCTSADVFVGTLRNRLTWQASAAVTPPSDPISITLTSLFDRSWGIPDIEFNELGIQGKRCIHAGVVGGPILAATSTTIQLSLFADNQFTTNQFAPDAGHSYFLMLVGLASNNQNLPIANWTIVSNDGDTLTISGPDPTTLDRGDGTIGLLPGDVVVITMRPTVGSDVDGNYIEDLNWDNALGSFGDTHLVIDATNATPIVIETADDHLLEDGNKVYIQAVAGNTGANGPNYAKKLTDTTFELYSDKALTTPVAGTGAYTGGGLVNLQFDGLLPDVENGNELYCAFGNGTGTYYKIKKNTRNRIYIEGEWAVIPDATSVFFVLSPLWEVDAKTSNINNSREDTAITFTMEIPNYSGTTMFIQSFTRDGGGNEAFRSLSPWRILYIFGQESALQISDMINKIRFTQD